ncbi:MAG: hypothetical protein HQK89_03220 [Nitrospirae bacterium]|nr:hypothetical protein [Nitrospirota bacterium]
MKTKLVLTIAIAVIITITGNIAYAYNSKQRLDTGNASAPPIRQNGDKTGFVYETSLSPQYLVIGERTYNTDQAVFSTVDGAAISFSDISKGSKVKLLFDQSGVVTNVILYKDSGQNTGRGRYGTGTGRDHNLDLRNTR